MLLLLGHAHGTPMLRVALACIHPCIGAVAAAAVRRVAAYGNGRHVLLEQGFAHALLAICCNVGAPLQVCAVTLDVC